MKFEKIDKKILRKKMVKEQNGKYLSAKSKPSNQN